MSNVYVPVKAMAKGRRTRTPAEIPPRDMTTAELTAATFAMLREQLELNRRMVEAVERIAAKVARS